MKCLFKATPTLTGKDARRFEKILKENEKTTVRPELYQRAMRVFQSTKKPGDSQG